MRPFISQSLSFTCNGKKINSRVLMCSFTVSRIKVMSFYLFQVVVRERVKIKVYGVS